MTNLIFKSEKEDGFVLEALFKPVLCSGSIQEFTNQIPSDSEKLIIDRLKASKGSVEENPSFDLHYLRSLMVSTVWNENDDVFDKYEVWPARYSAKDKPFNYEHNCEDIIGHMVASYPVNEEGALIPDDISGDELPDKYHILSHAVLYKFWPVTEKQERMDKLLAEIKEGKWHVSVEALFSGFDYALKSEDGTIQILARNDKTSHLTKYLRAYGGSGVVGNYRIGRLMRNITFSGKGLVKNPANPESDIIQAKKNTQEVSVDLSVLITDKEKVIEDITKQIIKNIEKNISEENNISTNAVYDNNIGETMNEKEFQEKIEQLTKELESVKASHGEAIKKISVFETQVNQLTEKNTKLEASLSEVNSNFEKVKSEKADVEKKIDEVNKVKVDLEKEVGELRAAKKLSDRVSLVVSKLNYDNEKAKDFVDNLTELSDEKFEKFVEKQVVVASKPEKKSPSDILDEAKKKTEPTLVVASDNSSGVKKVRDDIAGFTKAVRDSQIPNRR